jgi:hypothetical protein
MGQSRREITQNLAERLCWDVARRDDSRVARQLYRTPLVHGVYRLDKGALLDDFLHFLPKPGRGNLRNHAQGTTVQREMVPFIQYLWLYGLKKLFTVDRVNALPTWLFSAEVLI